MRRLAFAVSFLVLFIGAHAARAQEVDVLTNVGVVVASPSFGYQTGPVVGVDASVINKGLIFRQVAWVDDVHKYTHQGHSVGTRTMFGVTNALGTHAIMAGFGYTLTMDAPWDKYANRYLIGAMLANTPFTRVWVTYAGEISSSAANHTKEFLYEETFKLPKGWSNTVGVVVGHFDTTDVVPVGRWGTQVQTSVGVPIAGLFRRGGS